MQEPIRSDSLLLALALLGWLVDILYVRRGGVRPTWRQRGALLALAIGPLVALGLLGRRAENIGEVAANLWLLIFAGWEVRRFFVRRANPVRSAEPTKATPDK